MLLSRISSLPLLMMIYATGVLGYQLKPRQLDSGPDTGSSSGSSSDSNDSGDGGDLTIPNKCESTCADWQGRPDNSTQACSGADECCTNSMGKSLTSCLDCIVTNGGGSKADAQDYYDNVQKATINAALGSRSQCHAGAVMVFAAAATVPWMLA
ncbi:hypothetical protein K435DRAFT_808213 [Dendrothele bispora CBS 962.96]|uniref:Hydrophobin n=1 Tax=Dendrothele bispora (strain CBS 962.96) TaxID=1314807 RepID=A0A4S8KWD0_DENBC|nr:hypothetical protein K435DRAFT_810016 [Dendrothele bispora CBS 962.96]THU82546.1 hypothetical protein K435DRAFT_808213 [Dendrothele bispora CBS 962.96]